jgi:hypothetical protein
MVAFADIPGASVLGCQPSRAKPLDILAERYRDPTFW